MPSKWLDVKTYGAPALDDQVARLRDAQAADSEFRTMGIYSIELRTVMRGAAPEVQMVINRDWEREVRTTLSREHTRAIQDVLIFEARQALQRHYAGRELDAQDMGVWGLRRCPWCGLGPYGSHVRVELVLTMIAAATSMDEMYAVYDRHIVPVFDEIPQAARRLVIDALEARRPEFQKRPNQGG